MPRIPKDRFVQYPPRAFLFKPQGIPLRDLKRVIIALDEFEILRWVDHLGKDLEEASSLMGVSRATAGRILEQARKKTAEALCEGLAILIEGGRVIFEGTRFYCSSCGHVWAAKGHFSDHEGSAGTEEISPGRNNLDPCPKCAGTNIRDLGARFRNSTGPGGKRGYGHGRGRL